ncbi:MAG: caspase family protein [Chloroflexi bacterium]|nr:caspase family protein [Chloroflexota bacterium]
MARKYALLIGNAQFKDAHFAPLMGPDKDVIDLEELLSAPEIGDFQVEKLIDQGNQEIRKAIEGFFAKRKSDEMVLLYFSGHGKLDDMGQLCLIANDTEAGMLGSTSIDRDFVLKQMDRCNSRQQVLVLDCCFSGSFAKGVKAEEQHPITQATFAGGTGRAVITATSSTQFAKEGSKEQSNGLSLFTYYLVEGLRTGLADRDENGQITLDELYDYISDNLKAASSRQTPMKWVYGQDGQLVIARNPNAVLDRSMKGFVQGPRSKAPAAVRRKSDGIVSELVDGVSNLDYLPVRLPEILVEPQKKVYAPGDRLQVEIPIGCSLPYDVERISVEFTARKKYKSKFTKLLKKEKFEVRTDETSGERVKVSLGFEEVKKEFFDQVDETIPIASKVLMENRHLNQGYYEPFTFVWQIPTSISPTYQGEIVDLECGITLKVMSSSFWGKSILGTREAYFAVPVSAPAWKGTPPKGHSLVPALDAAFDISKLTYLPGEKVEGTLHLHTREKFDGSKISIALVSWEKVLLGAGHHTARRWSEQTLASKVSLQAGENWEAPFSLDLPLNFCPTMENEACQTGWRLFVYRHYSLGKRERIAQAEFIVSNPPKEKEDPSTLYADHKKAPKPVLGPDQKMPKEAPQAASEDTAGAKAADQTQKTTQPNIYTRLGKYGLIAAFVLVIPDIVLGIPGIPDLSAGVGGISLILLIIGHLQEKK